MQKQLKYTGSWWTSRNVMLRVALFFAVAFLFICCYRFVNPGSWLQQVFEQCIQFFSTGNVQNGWAYAGMQACIILMAGIIFLWMKKIALRKKIVGELITQKASYRSLIKIMRAGLTRIGILPVYSTELIIERPYKSYGNALPYTVMNHGAGRITSSINMLNKLPEEDQKTGGIINEEKKYNTPTAQHQASVDFITGVFDALSGAVVVVNEAGTIVKANASWKKFAGQDGVSGWDISEASANYFDVCGKFCSGGDFMADKARAGMHKVLNGSLNEFELEYPCHTSREECWFYIRIKRLEIAAGLLVIEQHDITESRRKAIIDAQEKERRFIGEELHDNVNQLLASTLLILEMVNHFQKEPDRVIEFTARAKEYTLDAMREIRKLSHELLPATFDNATLKDIFENLLTGINVNSQYKLQFYFDESINGLVCQEVQISLYRILQEQVKNILKYAGADSIDVAVTNTGNAIRMRTYDNGKGFDTNTVKGGIGLNNMRRRVESFSGKLILNSDPGNGCEIIVEIPYGQRC